MQPVPLRRTERRTLSIGGRDATRVFPLRGPHSGKAIQNGNTRDSRPTPQLAFRRFSLIPSSVGREFYSSAGGVAPTTAERFDSAIGQTRSATFLGAQRGRRE